MSKFHKTLSRRDFMKILGATSTGVGCAAAVTPVLHDLDEAMSISSSEIKSFTSMMIRPW